MCWDMNSHLHKYTLIRISIKIDPHIYPPTRTHTFIHTEKYFSTIIGLPIYNVIHTLLIRKFCTYRYTHTPEIFMYNSILFLFLIHSHKYNSLIFIWYVRVCTGVHVCVYVCIHLSGQDYIRLCFGILLVCQCKMFEWVSQRASDSKRSSFWSVSFWLLPCRSPSLYINTVKCLCIKMCVCVS